MHVGLLIYGDLETVSGGYLYDRKLVESLRTSGDQVDLISLPWREYSRHLLDNFSTEFYRRLVDFKGELLLEDELNHPSLFWLNRRIHRELPYPLLSIVHHLRCLEPRPAWQNHFFRWIERRYLETIDGFIFNSETTRASVREAGINLAAKPHVVAFPAGDEPGLSSRAIIDHNRIKNRANEPGPIKLVFVGNLIPRKGLHILLRGMAQLRDGACQLTVIGNPGVDPGYTRQILHQIEQLHLGAQVRMLGLLPASKLGEELQEHHVMAVPSLYEGYGIVYLEGMAFGLPAIATRSGAASEIITHGENGFLIDPEDPYSLAKHINELSGDRIRLAAMGLAARNRFIAQPTWSETAASIRSFLQAFLVQQRASPNRS